MFLWTEMFNKYIFYLPYYHCSAIYFMIECLKMILIVIYKTPYSVWRIFYRFLPGNLYVHGYGGKAG